MNEPTGTTEPSSSPSPANGEATVTELTPYQRRKQREQERQDKREAARKRREEKAAAAPAEAAAPAPAAETVDEAKLQRSLSVFLKFIWRVAGLAAWLFGYRLEPLTKEEALEDAGDWLPLGLHYRWFRLAVTWGAAPFLFVERIVTKLRPRKEEKPA